MEQHNRKFPRIRHFLSFSVLILIPQATAAQNAREEPLLLKPERVFTATDANIHPGWVVLIGENKIQAVRPEESFPLPPRVAARDFDPLRADKPSTTRNGTL